MASTQTLPCSLCIFSSVVILSCKSKHTHVKQGAKQHTSSSTCFFKLFLPYRILESGLLLTRPPEHIGRYKMVRHKKQTRSDHGWVFFRWHDTRSEPDLSVGECYRWSWVWSLGTGLHGANGSSTTPDLLLYFLWWVTVDAEIEASLPVVGYYGCINWGCTSCGGVLWMRKLRLHFLWWGIMDT